MSTRGHLFVVHGRIEHLVHDAAVIPVDKALRFSSAWDSLLAGSRPEAPATWSEGWGQVGSSSWILEVGDGEYDLVLKRLELVLQDISRQTTDIEGGRTNRLVALPVLGIGFGGHGHEQGHVVRQLVDYADRWVGDHPIDIALVTPEPSVYAAAQYARKAHASVLPEPSEALAQELGSRAKRDELALFLGAGVSMSAGLPSWGELLKQLTEHLEPSDKEGVAKLQSPTDQAELIQIASPDEFRQRVTQIVSGKSCPGLLHALLAGLDVHRAVTTNYDRLYEKACKAAGHKIKSVMPRRSATGASRWILKLHGDVKKNKSIVLTRRHMVRYDAANRPSAAVLQSLLLTHHLLVIGASLTDDNVIRLALEVQEYRETHQRKNSDVPFGTVLDASDHGDRARASLWKGQLAWHHLAGEDDLIPATRALELFVDRVGYHASRDSSWLLDERFEGLLESSQDRTVARRGRDLMAALRDSSQSHWDSLRAALSDHGA